MKLIVVEFAVTPTHKQGPNSCRTRGHAIFCEGKWAKEKSYVVDDHIVV